MASGALLNAKESQKVVRRSGQSPPTLTGAGPEPTTSPRVVITTVGPLFRRVSHRHHGRRPAWSSAFQRFAEPV